MFLFLSNKIKFIVKSVAYYFAFTKPVVDGFLKKYLVFEEYFLFWNKESIEYTLTKNTSIRLHKNSFLTSLVINNFEHEELIFLKHVLSKGDIVFDIGANIGIYTLLSSRYIGENGIVYSFEPSPIICAELNFNIVKNDLKNVSVNMLAVSDTSNQLLNLYENVNGFDALNNLINPVSETDIISIVNTITIDDFILKDQVNINKIKFVKIDVEGWELNVLKGAKMLLENQLTIAFLVEFNDNDTQKNTDVFNFMNHYNYNWYVFDIITTKLKYFDKIAISDSINLIAIHDNFKIKHPNFF